MKKQQLFITPVLTGVLVLGGLTLLFNNKESIKVEAASLPKTIDISDTSSNEIKNYYSSLSTLPDSELTGTNLLKNLKSIIANNVTYFSYDQVTSAYLITDRDWVNSSASAMDGYNGSSVKIAYSSEASANPYIHMLYHDYTNPAYNKTKYSGDGDVSTSTKSFDNEHAWSQSHGFSSSSEKNITGAGSDMHHLIAGTQYGNRTLHNNYSYGFVKTNDGDWSSVPQERYNKRGEPLFDRAGDQQNRVFEPQDCDKGDIARALLYMVACYNNYDGSTPTKASPALKLQDYVITEESTGFSFDNIANGYYGRLSDILAWHKLDPVDDYEIHRNNLIYNNYQHNRNPFIDYPEWVDYIWGTADYDSVHQTVNYDSTSTGAANLSIDVINGYKTEYPVTSLEIVSGPSKTTYHAGEKFDSTGMVVIATLEDSTTMNITSNCRFEIDMNAGGTKTLRVRYGSVYADLDTPITIIELTNFVLVHLPNKTSYVVGETLDLTGMVAKAIFDDSSEEDVTELCHIDHVDMNTAGNKTVVVRYADKNQRFVITVKDATEDEEPQIPMLYIYIGAAVVGVIIIILIFAGVLKVNKKGKVKVNKKQVKKIVKGTSKKKK